MKDYPIRLGPLALLLTLIAICLTVLGILTYTTAQADLRLAETYAATVRERYALETEGQEFVRDLYDDPFSAMLDADGPDMNGLMQVVLENEDGLSLTVGFRLNGVEPEIRAWRYEKAWAEDTAIGNLWDGN